MYNFFSKKINKKRKGFTLVELLVVIAIIAILVAIAAIAFGKVTTKAAISAHNANVRTLQSVAAVYSMSIDSTTEVTLTKDATGDLMGGNLQEWPKIPKGAGLSEDDYTVKILNGVITVTPGAVAQP